ncbi:MAG: thiamine pyrophosphate-binding protein [Pelagibacterales bacterium]|nr:thiamine pyrophosphate-binding protein [Pelagibacterales bacterium]
MIKVSDFIAKELVKFGVKHVFMISGGGAMHLNDSLGKHEQLEYVCNHHEQASAIAAEGYARTNQKLAVVNVTTGPGGVNALNGVFGQWTDSVPALYISGQVKLETTLSSVPNLNLRQLGDQEVDIISVVKPITKYAEMVKDPKDIKRILHKAMRLATTGRMGPTWIDIPINIQGALIDENDLIDDDFSAETNIEKNLSENALKVIEAINSAKRPVIVAGNGIRVSKTVEVLHQIIDKLQIPVLTTFNGVDVVSSNHPLCMGRIGTVGQRAGNFVLQNADLVLFLGTRNNIRQVSYNWEMFARNAKKIVVDVDDSELNKPTLKIDLKICADLKEFLPILDNRISQNTIDDKRNWVEWSRFRKEKYSPQNNAEYKKSFGAINPYNFIISLTKLLKEDATIVAANGTACVALFQAAEIKKNQRVFWNSGDASMGYDLPAAIGACFANDKKEVICVAGDGSIMMNLQELQTIKHYNLPIKIFVLNNSGYSSIRQTQRNFFGEKLVACSPESGVSVPNFARIAAAFDIDVARVENNDNLETQITEVLSKKGAVVCEVILDNDYIFQPKLSSEKLPDGRMISKPLEDMYPFLDREELESNMIK